MIVFSHRGKLNPKDPENTLYAFSKLYRNGIKNVELDIRKTKDNVLVVIHDKDTKRISDENIEISKARYSDVSKVKIFDNHKIPTLENSLKSLKDLEVINIEIKQPGISSLLNEFLIDFLNENSNFKPKLLISSRIISEINKITTSNRISTAYILNIFVRLRLKYTNKHPKLIVINRKFINSRIIKYSSMNSIEIYCYTVNTLEEKQRLYNLGISGLYTDNPIQIK